MQQFLGIPERNISNLMQSNFIKFEKVKKEGDLPQTEHTKSNTGRGQVSCVQQAAADKDFGWDQSARCPPVELRP